ncbi:PEPxxWA-CTERM sorting domain-containing protein [Kordiimonas sp. SCSIO 12610]|uniref:PEPxxWA-CTERM sorting domain-containing protein n=1 Tax=Kordiimonas sp. SCSIO 12610 TaxID=2829597 RepID=UPI0021091280|nr:PEPxxWA-CTERM sorting domain-containing protein [Kordiimonas sp. SCSIO 12610]UTW54377.1 PEP-CTERM sorting domain-containing protein [Kordiimonas sp. SCSIO 12610]
MKKIFITIFALLSLGTTANAQSQTFRFTGDVNFQNLTVASVFGFDTLVGSVDGNFTVDANPRTRVEISNSIQDLVQFEYSNLNVNIGSQSFSYTGNITGDVTTSNIVRLIDRKGSNISGDFLQLIGNSDVSVGSTTITSFFVAFNSSADLITSAGINDIGAFTTIAPSNANPGGFGSSAGFARFANTSISAVSAIPEPATWLMMIIGFAVAGLQLKRRRFTHKHFA